MNDFIKCNGVQDHVFAYLDNWILGGHTEEQQYNKYLEILLNAAKTEGCIFNEKKDIEKE